MAKRRLMVTAVRRAWGDARQRLPDSGNDGSDRRELSVMVPGDPPAID